MVPTTDDLRLRLHGDLEHAVVGLEGELNGSSAPFVRDVVEQLLAEPDCAGRIEIHLDELELCDPAGADLIVHLDRVATRAGRNLVVVHPTPTVRNVLARAHRDLRVDIE